MTGRAVFVFDAELLNVSGVSATVAVAAHEHLTALHDAIQQAFNWENDHLTRSGSTASSGASHR